jgi:microcystin degradation protein MlrC
MKMFVAVLGTETNTFSPLPTGFNAWQDMLLVHRNDSADNPLNPAALLEPTAKQRGWEIRRGLLAYATPAGLTPKSVYTSLSNELLDDLKAEMPVDGVSLLLHGAMVADGCADCEGDILANIREIVGPDVPVGAVLDLHANVSDQMIEQATVLVGYKEYPHTDIFQRLIDLFNIVADTAEEKICPVMSTFDAKMIGVYHTTAEPMQSFVREMEELESRPEVLNVWLAHCFPWGDVPFIGARTVVVTDNNKPIGNELAGRLGRKFFGMRNEVLSRPDSLSNCLQRAQDALAGPVTIADTADNPGGGAPADSTFFLKEMLNRGIENAAIATLWDPVAVTLCEDGGIGACLDLRIGGKMGPTSGDPVDVSATVVGLAGDIGQELGGVKMSMGRCAAAKVRLPGNDDRPSAADQGIDVILSQHRTQTVAPNIFTELGIDPCKKKILVVKSSQHFQAAFAPISKEILYAGDLGALSGDLLTIKYKNVDTSRYWPFVDNPFNEQGQ